ncbi:pyridoxamine 5'-phosphate oxidase family protein [Microbacterium sp. TNHR37B]|uniref:pyridoxamine 5'-phosphate oxidase family protein n=1 Tax=Microbacterium sp. TNHR37B TaxID=1775956 RepID=UPI0007B2F815|nr:pyridoxamine 5'-phosphate oxidase family protein [Microbacterium sp. TNHR37B]KZE91499.1 hypothetical protein AVP41_01041 [Microbacterium sp. TNHR37B]
MTTQSPSTHLETAECWTLLERRSVGRLAMTDAEGAPDIFPVNFVTFEGAVFIRTAADIKDVQLTTRPSVAFEVDGHDDAGWWSVVIRGTAAQATDPVELERSGVRRLSTASPRRKPHVLKITAAAVTGRRFANHDDQPTRPTQTRHGATPADPHLMKSATRPTPIPSLPPLTDHP